MLIFDELNALHLFSSLLYSTESGLSYAAFTYMDDRTLFTVNSYPVPGLLFANAHVSF
jgi:hypothetical protein